MDIWAHMKNCENEMTPKEQEVYKLVKKYPAAFTASTSVNLAARFGIAQSSISRFCQKIGYSSFGDFRMSLVLASQNQSFSTEYADHDLAFYMSQLILETRQAIPNTQLDALARRIISSTGIYLSGHGNSNPPANILSLQLLLARQPAHLIQPSFEIEHLHIIKNTDIMILFSAQNPTFREFVSFVADLPEEDRPYLVLIANTKKHPLRHMVNEVVCLPDRDSLHYPIAVDTSTSPVAFCYFLADRVRSLAIGRGNDLS